MISLGLLMSFTLFGSALLYWRQAVERQEPWFREVQSPRDQARERWTVGVLGWLSAFPIVVAQSLYAYSAAALLLAVMLTLNHMIAPPNQRARLPRVLNRLVAACIFALGAVVVSSAVHQVPASLSVLPGLVALTFFLAAFSIAVRSEESALSGLIATSAALCLATIFFGHPLVRSGPEALWKYGLATPFTLLALAISAKRWSHTAPLVLAVIGVGSIAFGSRSHGAICLIAVAVLLVRRVFPVSRTFTMLMVPLLLLGAYVGLNAAIEEGVFGSGIQEKAVWQDAQGDSALLVGRAEAILSLTVIINHPLGGIGSARSIPSDVLQEALRNASAWAGISESAAMHAWFPRVGEETANLHSIILAAWVEGGVVATLPFAGILAVFWTAATVSTSRFSIIYIFMFIFSTWHLFFSPWSYGLMQVLAVTAVGATHCLRAPSETRAPDARGIGR